MEISGEVKFSNDSAPEVLPENSYLTVKFEDVSLMDAPSVKLGESVVDVTKIYKKGQPLLYSIKCPKPSPIHVDYSVSAVLNVGWKADDNRYLHLCKFCSKVRQYYIKKFVRKTLFCNAKCNAK